MLITPVRHDLGLRARRHEKLIVFCMNCCPTAAILGLRARMQNTIQVKYTNRVQTCTGLDLLLQLLNQRLKWEKLVCFDPVKACLFLDQIKREKGVWWMPWQ